MSKGGAEAEIRLLRSTGLEDVISFPLQSTTLRELKLAVSKSDRLGRIPTTQQRVFHLGKELKAPGQILSDVLMIQKSGVVHVHATPPKEIVDLADDDEDDDVDVDDDDDDCVLLEEGPSAAANKRRRVA